MKTKFVCAFVLGLCTVGAPRAAAGDDAEEPASSKEALQALNEYIGDWKGTGDVEKAKAGSKTFWSETVSWSWRFKKDDAWLAMTIKNGKLFKSGEMRYSTDTKKYQLTALDLERDAAHGVHSSAAVPERSGYGARLNHDRLIVEQGAWRPGSSWACHRPSSFARCRGAACRRCVPSSSGASRA